MSDCILFTIWIFGGLLTIGLPSMVLQRLLVYGIPYTYIPHLIFYIIPECLQFLLPSSLMMGAIVTFARMGAENEITVLKSSGIQPIRLVYPLLTMSFILSFGACYINDISAICRERGIRNVLLNGSEDIVISMLKAKGEINRRNFRIKANSVENGYLYGVSIHYMASLTSTPIDAEAQVARIQADKDRRVFILELTNCYFRGGDASGELNERESFLFPIDVFLPRDTASHITNAPVLKMIKDFSILNKNIKEAQDNLAGDTTVILLSSEYGLYDSEVFKNNRANLTEYVNTYKKAIIEPFRRITLGFACFSLVIFSAPLAIYFNKVDMYYNIAGCTALGIGIFFFLFMAGLNLGKQGVIPPWMICFADIIPIIAGVILIKYVSKK